MGLVGRRFTRRSPDGTTNLYASQDHHPYPVHPDGSALTKINPPPGHASGPA